MKFYTVLFFTFISSLFFAQEETKLSEIFNEFTVSLNQTLVKNANTSKRLGFGAGIFHSWRDSKRISLVSGLTYNYTNQFKKHIALGHFGGYSDASVAIHSLSIPFFARFNFGKKTRAILETGVFVGTNPIQVVRATLDSDFNDDKKVKDKTGGNLDAGLIIGLGTIVPVGKHEILFKLSGQCGFGNWDLGHETISNRFISCSAGFRLGK